MGTKFSRSLANLYIEWWERHGIFALGSACHSDTLFYCRYIDNLLFIVSNEVNCLDNWLSYLNNNDLNLQFTGCWDPISVDSLDVWLRGVGNKVVASLFRKPSAVNMLL